MQFKLDRMRKEYGQYSKEIGAVYKSKGKGEEAEELVRSIKEKQAAFAIEISEFEKLVDEKKEQVDKKLNLIGNIVHESVPVSNDEKDNGVVVEWGEFKFQENARKHHHELLYMIDGYDAARGVKVAGHRAYFLKGIGVRLNQALIAYGTDFLIKNNYTVLQTPFFMNKDMMAKTAQLEDFNESLYTILDGDDQKFLIATSEQPISAFHAGEWLDEKALPIKYSGISTCFRKEAGAYGKDTWGIFRVHQFEKVEQFCITEPEKSWEEHESMLKNSEAFYQSVSTLSHQTNALSLSHTYTPQFLSHVPISLRCFCVLIRFSFLFCSQLGLPYRVVTIVSAELNNAAAKKYDLEGWFPAFGEFRELVSASNCTDYQSRSLEVRCGIKKKGEKEKKYVHMLNSTLCATTRTICCILENYQTETGVRVPEVLRPYLGGLEFIPFVNQLPKDQKEKKQEQKGGNGKEKADKAN